VSNGTNPNPLTATQESQLAAALGIDWSKLTPAQQQALLPDLIQLSKNPLVGNLAGAPGISAVTGTVASGDYNPLDIFNAAQQGLGAGVASVASGAVGGIFSFVASAIGNFVKNFTLQTIAGLGAVSSQYVVGLVVAAVVVFILLEGPGGSPAPAT